MTSAAAAMFRGTEGSAGQPSAAAAMFRAVGAGEGGDRAARPEAAAGLWDSFVAGMQTSTSGLVWRQESPDVILQRDAGRADRLVSLVGQTLGDIPTLAIGSYLGAAAGGAIGGAAGAPAAGVGAAPGALVGAAIGAGAGGFGLTEGTRTWLLEQYSRGYTKSDLADRLTATAWAFAKGAVVGGATAGAGKIAGGAASALAPTVRVGAVTGSELATMVTVSHALEGELPGPSDFVDGAIILGGLKAAHTITGKLQHIYARTGAKPDAVVKDAIRDSKVWQELADDGSPAIPEKMRGREKSPLAPPTPERAAQLEAFSADPFRELGPREDWKRTEVNYERYDESDAVLSTVKGLSEHFEEDMKTAQRGRVSWDQTDIDAANLVREWLGEDGMKSIHEPGTVSYAAEIRARREILLTTVSDFWDRAYMLGEKGSHATPEDMAGLLLSADRARVAQEALIGRKAELGRGLNALKNAQRVPELSKRQADLLKAIDKNGGKEAVDAMVRLTRELSDPAAVARALRKPSTFDKVLELYKAMLVSGPRTAEVNVLSNLAFAATRVPKEVVAAAYGLLSRKQDRVHFTDALALTLGMAKGSIDAVRAGYRTTKANIEDNGFLSGLVETYRGIGPAPKAEQAAKPAIGGVAGEVVRAPFKVLSAGDAISRTMNRQGELYALASRQALKEGLTPLGKRYMERVQALVANPTRSMEKAAEEASLRYSFLEEGGALVKGLQQLRRNVPVLHFIIPFLNTPGAIFREFTRLTPFAPFLEKWRADFKAGGASRQRALAEVSLGLAVTIPTFLMARDGTITGAGHPDRKVRDAWRAAGWQPYSVKLSDGSYLSYARYEPLGTLLGLAADLATAWELMETPEQDKAAQVILFATTQVVQNKTWLKGLSSLINAISDPGRYGEGYLEGLASSLVPSFVGQTAQELDPYVREVDGILSAVQARIPKLRESLPVRRDIFGEPIPRAEGTWAFSPSTVTQESTDKVRLEAARLGVSQAPAPTSIEAGSILGKAASVDLTAEQRDIFASESGRTAYELLSQAVNGPGWDDLHPMVQRRFYERAFAMARRKAGILALPPKQRVAAINELRGELGL